MTAAPGPRTVRIVEMFFRDGLQALGESELAQLSARRRVEAIRELAAAGIGEAEVASFGRPDVVPGAAAASAVVSGLAGLPGMTVRALVPNVRGLERALAAGLQKAALFVVCSETYQAKNVRMTVAENCRVIAELKRRADAAGIETCVGIGTAFVCPYEGPVAPERVLALVDRFAALGFGELAVADSPGLATPAQVETLCAAIGERRPDISLGLHLHDRAGIGFANALAGVRAGIDRLECSLLGIGAGIAMPDHPRLLGNLATEPAAALLARLGVSEDIDFEGLCAVSRRVSRWIGEPWRMDGLAAYRRLHAPWKRPDREEIRR